MKTLALNGAFYHAFILASLIVAPSPMHRQLQHIGVLRGLLGRAAQGTAAGLPGELLQLGTVRGT